MTFDCHNIEGTEIGHLNAVHTTEELKLTGNHLRGSRPLLSFSSEFNEHPHLQLLKELLTQVLYMLKLKATCFLHTLLNCKTVVEMRKVFFSSFSPFSDAWCLKDPVDFNVRNRFS